MERLEKLFLQMVGNEVGSIGVDAALDVLLAKCIVALNDYLIDDAKVQVFKQESKLFFVARKLCAKGVVDCTRCIEDNLQLLFGKFVVVDFHCFGFIG